MDEGKVSALIETIYNSAFEENGWDHLLQSLRTQFHASHASFVIIDGAEAFTFSTLDSESLAPYRDYYHKVDPGNPANNFLGINYMNTHMLEQPESFPIDALMERSKWLNSEFYFDFARQNDMAVPLCSFLSEAEKPFAYFVIHHASPSKIYCENEIKLIASLAPHLNRGLRLYLELSKLRSRAGLFESTFDALAASFLLDASGRILQLNEMAEAMLADDGGPLIVADGHLAVRHTSDADKLSAALAPPTPGAPPPDVVLRGLTGSLRISVTPVNGGDIPLFFDVTRKARAAFLVTARPLGPSLQNLMAAYSLTRAEAEVTLLLLEGAQAAQIAAHRVTSIGTVNTQIKHIYAKTGVPGHAALIVKLLRL